MGEYILLNALIVLAALAKWLSREPFNIRIWDLYGLGARGAGYIRKNR